MWRCPKCRHRTEIKTQPNCNCDIRPDQMQKIEVVHKAVQTPLGRKILCSNSPPKQGARAVGGNYGITCIRCKQAMKEGKAAEFPVNEAKSIDELPPTPESDTIQPDEGYSQKVDLSNDEPEN